MLTKTLSPVLGLLLLSGLFLAACTPDGPPTPPGRDTAPATVLARGLAWVLGQQSAPGAFGPAAAPAEMTASTVPVLAQLATAVAQGEDAPLDAALEQAAGVLVGQMPGWPRRTDSGPLAKALLALAAVGEPSHRAVEEALVADLAHLWDPETGLYHPESLFRHSLAIRALHTAGRPVPPEAFQALARHQQPDGSWSWRIPGEGSQTTAGDVDTTAFTLLVLAETGHTEGDAMVQQALAFLARAQQSTGGWSMEEGSDANANSTGLVLQALGALQQVAPEVAGIRAGDAQRWLSRLQQPDGSFWYTEAQPGAVLAATLDALPAFRWDFRSAPQTQP